MKQAACILLIDKATRKVWTVTRRDSTQIGLPGGKVDPGETHIVAALRELREETGLQLFRTSCTLLYEGECTGEVHYWTKCYVAEITEQPPGGNEAGINVKLVDWAELLSNSPFVEYNKRVISEYQQMLINREQHSISNETY